MHKHTILFAMLFMALSLNVSAQRPAPPSECDFKLECENSGKKFEIHFASENHECSDDDMTAVFQSPNRTEKLSIPKAWYRYTYDITKTRNSICSSKKMVDHFAVYNVGRDRALFFISKDDRPGNDEVVVVLMDTDRGAVLDQKKLGHTRLQSMPALKTSHGFKTRIIRDSLSFHKEVSCDCDAPYVDDWMEIKVDHDKLSTGWM